MEARLLLRFSLFRAAFFLLCFVTRLDSQAADLILKGSQNQYIQFSGSNDFGTLGCCSWAQYDLVSGSLHCDTLQLGACGEGGTFYQSGGDLNVASVAMTGWLRYADQGIGRFSLNGGTARVDTISVHNAASCDQSAGVLSVNSLQLNGEIESEPDNYIAASYAGYALTNGSLLADSESLSIGYFVQEGGTNTLTGSLVLGGDQYWGWGPKFGSQYQMDDGTLLTTNIVVGGCSSFTCDGTNSWNINNPGTFSLAGNLRVGNNSQQLGALALFPGPSPSPLNPTITLSTRSVLRFEDSNSQSWNANGLIIDAWAGSVFGGGSCRLVFGTNSLALSSAQLAQIIFTNAVGLPQGAYSAMILASGEVVPNVPLLFWNISGSKLILKWVGLYTLQTATDPQGPWSSLSTTDNMYTNNFAGDRRFFRLAQ